MREQPRRLARRGPIGKLYPDIAGLEQAAKAAGWEPVLHPLAEGQQGARRPRERDGQAGAHGHGPVVPQGLLPHQRNMGVRGARDLDVIERYTGAHNAAEDLLDFSFAPAGVEEGDLFAVRGPRSAVRFRGK